MKQRIYEDDNWILDKDDNDNIIISYFVDGHYKDEVVLTIKDNNIKMINKIY